MVRIHWFGKCPLTFTEPKNASNNHYGYPITRPSIPDSNNSTAAAKPDLVQSTLELLTSTTDTLDLLFKFLDDALSPVTNPLSILLKGLLTPVVFLVRILLLIVKFLLDVLLYGLVTLVLGPLLSALGMEDLTQTLKIVIDIVDLLLDSISCLLAKLSYFSYLLPGCGSSGGFSQRDKDHAVGLLGVSATDLVPK